MRVVADHPPVVVDNGTGYTKLGFASNSEPSFVLPTCVSVDFDDHHQNRRDAIQNATGRTPPGGTSRRRTTKTNAPFFSNATSESHRSLSDLNYSIGDDALARIHSKTIKWPISNGVVNDWTSMEKFWQTSVLGLLRAVSYTHLTLPTIYSV